MVSGEFVIGAIEATVGIGQVYALVAPTGAQKSALFTNMDKKAKALAIIRAPEGNAMRKDPDAIRARMVDSPLLRCLREMILGEQAWPYVFYAPPSSGKTSAARAFMHFYIPHLFPDPVTRPKALMLTGTMALEASSYFHHVSDTFIAGSTSWFAPLVAALSRTKEEIASRRHPSVLILDDFDVAGKDNVNITNMKKFCHDLAALRDLEHGEQYEIYVVIITQSRDVANKLCRINNWQKIAPMPRTYNPPVGNVSKSELPDPDWTELPWTSDQLQKMVEKRFTEEELSGVEWETLCIHGEIPGTVLRQVAALVRRKSSNFERAAIDEFD